MGYNDVVKDLAFPAIIRPSLLSFFFSPCPFLAFAQSAASGRVFRIDRDDDRDDAGEEQGAQSHPGCIESTHVTKYLSTWAAAR